ncbi:sidekick-1-like 4, partial [Homarus americanus]
MTLIPTSRTQAKVMDQSSQLFVNWTAAQGVGSPGAPSVRVMVVVQIHHLAEHTITQLRPGPPTTCVWPPTKTEYNNDKCTNTTTDEDKPGPPVIMSVEPAPSSSLRVSWSTPEKPNGVITNYTITWTWEGHMDHTITPDNTYTTTDLLPCTTYSVTVRAATSKGYGPES